ncbi:MULTISPECIES: hypothetical protein [Cyanophyceae]|uniref:hypothetical protein n=1 Tax=Cyanophyceae TaxID=3028117 RepID=UPI0016873ACD|nr:hypothetical protein [Trichocoleus sp. FACHB-40]MBD2005828.1 hypothetical protein [Trichocoleus sp. FACHB-40]
MSGAIYLIQDNGQLVEMNEKAYDSEALLQELLAKYPNLLAGDQIDTAAPRKWLLVKREVGVLSQEGGIDRWSVDHLFLDQDGIPTLVEVKRSTDTRLRREVVGQMLDYAANGVVYWPVEKIIAQFEATCQFQGGDSEQILAEFLGADADQKQFWQQVKTNLLAGKIHLVFVADKIPTELQRVVEFLNKQMNPAEVLAVEIKQYVGQGLRTLVPRVIGQIVDKNSSVSVTEKRQWDKLSFFKELEEKQGSDQCEAAKKILEWISPDQIQVRWGKGSKYGTCIPKLNYQGKDYSLFTIWTDGTIQIDRRLFSSQDKVLEFEKRLDSLVEKTYPNYFNVFLSMLTDEAALKQFLETFDWVIQEIKAL